MEKPFVDFSFVYELSGDDQQYIYDVVSLFLSSIPEKVVEFEAMLAKSEDFAAIAELAHFLKSSSSVIKIRSMFDDLAEIELLARSEKGMDEIRERAKDVIANFREAMPVLLAEQEKNKPAAA